MAGRAGTSLARLAAVTAAAVVLATAWSGAALAAPEDDTTTTTTTTAAPVGSCTALTGQLTTVLAQIAGLSAQLDALGDLPGAEALITQIQTLQASANGLQTQVDAACATTTTTTTTTTTAVAPGSGYAVYGTDQDCRNFTSQQQAQDYFTSIGGSSAVNADRLDADHDGEVCEEYDYGALAGSTYGQVATVPVGGIDTGDGSLAP